MSGGKAGFHEGAEEAHTRQSGLNDGKSERQLRPHQPPIQCPECTSQRVWKDGVRATRYGDVQRYICRSCGYRFSESKVKFDVTSKLAEVPDSRSNLLDRGVVAVELSLQKLGYDLPLSRGEDVGSHKVTTVGEDLNSLGSYNRNRRVRAQENEAKNLAEVESRTEKRAAGATKPSEAEVKGKIVEFMWKLKREGYSESTISSYGYIIKTLAERGANLTDVESVKDIIAMQDTWSTGRKNIVAKAYSAFLKMQGLTWRKPNYRPASTLPFIPTEREIDDLIAGCSRQMATFLQLLKETAVRCGEALRLKWTDVDFVNNTLRITPEKGSEPRIFKISNKLATMLGSLSKQSSKVFSYKNTFYLRKTFIKQRRRIAHKLGNPRILQVHFHTFRHWKATMLYYQTKDILYVMRFLGHKNIKNTLIYVQLAEMISKNEDEYICKASKTLDEAKKLIETGFEFITDMDGYKLFRKRK